MEFKKFAKDHNISSSIYDDYFKKVSKYNNNFMYDGQGLPVDVFSKLLDDRIIFLSTEVDDYVCNMIKAQLLYLESESDKDIKIYIDSGGGSIYSGLGLLDVMDFVKPDIITVNTGLAASMAAVILCAGSNGKRKALKRSRTMIHQPSTYISYAQAADIEIEAKEMNSLKKELYDIIADKTGKSYEKVHNDSERDYWMTAQEALNYGMIDEIVKDKK